jgi:hypothetical protein
MRVSPSRSLDFLQKIPKSSRKLAQGAAKSSRILQKITILLPEESRLAKHLGVIGGVKS